ncbi:DNA methyltransferase [Brevundimonas sp.]|uniref:class I SAM-dependent DNA methyltransferase n=1 Tax=Brevundimonas sp. TaxID=1871086 RepID=UPI0017FC1195|nr:DNA methyltransferase [Brevundimonas sp.]MBA4806153.1 type II restriction endonuclease subunit M [Brevundimonas sp.]
MIWKQPKDVDGFIAHWADVPISERAQYQTFIIQLCRLIDAPAPDDERMGDLDYCFERPVRFQHEDGAGHPGCIDCAKRGCFVLEAKQSLKRRNGGPLDPAVQLALFAQPTRQGRTPSPDAVDRLMRIAKRQAENYAKALDEWPPFLVIVDVGRSIELWSDFARQGKAYAPFPDRANYRIGLDQLRAPEVRERLRRVWTDPMSLDPAAQVAEVTTDIAARLAWLVRSMRQRQSQPTDDRVVRAALASRTALFVMQCIFAMFADSVGLIENRGFLGFLERYRGKADRFHEAARVFFGTMDRGGHCLATQQRIRQFNGGLFSTVDPMPVTEQELEALIAAANCDWAMVEPAIFGALLEQALDPAERAELGAHYTPRAYVERLIEPTIMEPLRAEWEAVEAQAIGLYVKGEVRDARRMVRDFHDQLCRIRVLDPACGTGNFLYVAMRMMKELEGEVLGALAEMGEAQGLLGLEGHVVSPEQFHGLEKNAYAAWIAEMVMWIGYLQWHFRLFGDAQPSEPILKDFRRVIRTDALVSCSRVELARDAAGRVMTRPAGRLFDEPVDREIEHYVDPRPTPWPEVHFIVGNPPFIAGKDLRAELGDGYVEALDVVRGGRFRSADLVTAWWDRAAEILTREGSILRRFGFITTNSVTQTFSRRVIEHHLAARPPIRLVFAIPDHPWITGAGRADVRIAMSVAERGEPDGQGRWLGVVEEADLDTDLPRLSFVERQGVIGADLMIDNGLTRAADLKANAGLAYRGVQLMGAGFMVSPGRSQSLLSGSDLGAPSPLKPYRNGRDLADRARGVEAIDLFGWDEAEVRRRHPLIYQHLLETVKPERDRNNRAAYRDNWWIFGEPRRELRTALEGLGRYIVTVETAKHRWFRFLDASVLPDNKLVVIASDDPTVLAVLSSRPHRAWFAANAGRIGEYQREAVYVKGVCFDRFPFPDLTSDQAAELAALGEELDATRARVMTDHPALTMTGLYNARARLGEPTPLSEAERHLHDIGRIGILDHLHRRIDGVTAQAYGWSGDLTDAEMAARLARLNRDRVGEEAQGVVRFVRPDFQAGRVQVERGPVQTEAVLVAPTTRPRLPVEPGPLASALLSSLRRSGVPMRPDALAAFFDGGGLRKTRTIEHTLAVLAVSGAVQRSEGGWFAPRRAGAR